MVIGGFQKLSLLDYKDELSAVIFTRGCNFNCPYCHNSGLIEGLESELIDENEVLQYLEKRKNHLTGVVITGGEPTIQKDIQTFISKIKNIGLKIKLDTNGYNPEVLKKLIDNHLIDYVAMDLKSSIEKYDKVVGKKYDFDNIIKSIEIIENSNVEYEFRMTIYKPDIEFEDIKNACNLIKDKSVLYLQNFKMSDGVRNKNLIGYSNEELEDILNEIKKYHKKTILR